MPATANQTLDISTLDITSCHPCWRHLLVASFAPNCCTGVLHRQPAGGWQLNDTVWPGILSSMWFMACGMGPLHSSYLPVSPSHFIRRKFSSYLPHLLRMEGLVLVHFVLIVIEMWPVIKNPIRLQPGHLCTLQHFPVPGEGTLMPDIWISVFI